MWSKPPSCPVRSVPQILQTLVPQGVYDFSHCVSWMKPRRSQSRCAANCANSPCDACGGRSDAAGVPVFPGCRLEQYYKEVLLSAFPKRRWRTGQDSNLLPFAVLAPAHTVCASRPWGAPRSATDRGTIQLYRHRRKMVREKLRCPGMPLLRTTAQKRYVPICPRCGSSRRCSRGSGERRPGRCRGSGSGCASGAA